MLSGRGLCDELITRPEESYRLWCVVVCDLETSIIGAPHIHDISNLRLKPPIYVYLYCEPDNEKLQKNKYLNFSLNISFLIFLYYNIRFTQTNKQPNKCSCSATHSNSILVYSVCLQEKEGRINILIVSGVFVFLFLLFIFSFKIIPFAPVLRHRLPLLFFLFVFTFRLVLCSLPAMFSQANTPSTYHYLNIR